MVTPDLLEVAAHSLTAVLGAWLGLTVLTRSGGSIPRLFAFLALMLALWSTSIILNRLTTSAETAAVANALAEAAGAIVIPASAHLSLLVATEGHPTGRRVGVVGLAYLLNVVLALPAIFEPANSISLNPPHLTLGAIPGALLYWAWVVVRLGTLLSGAAWLAIALRVAGHDSLRRRQLRAMLVTVSVGALGGSIRFLPVVGESEPWIGVSLVTLSVVLAGYAVLSSRIFLAPDVASRAFGTGLAVGLTLVLMVGGLLAVDMASSRLLGLDTPLLTVLALVIAITVYEPAGTWIRRLAPGRSPGAIARDRLLRALGQPSLGAQSADAGVQPALTRITRVLGLSQATIVAPDGTVLASEGSAPPDQHAAMPPAISLVADDEHVGELRLGPTRSGRPLSPRDDELLQLSATYVAAALRTGRLEERQAEVLAGLSEDRAFVDSTAVALHAALVRRSTAAHGLHVFALGPLRVDRGDGPITRWGGEKAGTRQAQGLFAFLFDRGERGVPKDEAVELIWPDTDLDRADLAFHRTLAGLRHTLDPDGGGKQVIRFQNDRYRLDPSIVDWSDVDDFLARIGDAREVSGRAEKARRLQEAGALYRGDYLDDCPFYGDSVHVEARRSALRERYIDLLIALGETYEADADRMSAATAYREAIRAALDGCPPAEAGLIRLGITT